MFVPTSWDEWRGVHSLDEVSQLVEALGDEGPGLLESRVLRHRRLRGLVGASAGVTKLDLLEGWGINKQMYKNL